jgi:hypothetical protein
LAHGRFCSDGWRRNQRDLARNFLFGSRQPRVYELKNIKAITRITYTKDEPADYWAKRDVLIDAVTQVASCWLKVVWLCEERMPKGVEPGAESTEAEWSHIASKRTITIPLWKRGQAPSKRGA